MQEEEEVSVNDILHLKTIQISGTIIKNDYFFPHFDRVEWMKSILFVAIQFNEILFLFCQKKTLISTDTNFTVFLLF